MIVGWIGVLGGIPCGGRSISKVDLIVNLFRRNHFLMSRAVTARPLAS